MHYTAMEGLTLLPFASSSASAPALSTDLLAIIVAVVAFCLSGIFLLILVPDPARAANPLPAVSSAAIATTVPAAAEVQSSGGNGHDASPEFGRGTYGPLGGGGAPRRFARHLPIERDGGTHFVAVDDVVAIHANAHYTYIFNGSDKLFCPLAIGDVESRLDKDRFVRIHRSHIVNIERVVGYKRSGDNEMVEMDAGHDYAVPVSRSRIGSLKSRVAALTGEDLRRRHHFAAR
jgi:DNA-binding LytR/AlgR family response regulator